MTITQKAIYAAVALVVVVSAASVGKDKAKGASAAKTHRSILVDRAYLDAHPKDLRVLAIARGGTFRPSITLHGDFCRDHLETRANIRSTSGKLLFSVLLLRGDIGDRRVLQFEFSRSEVTAESDLEVTVRREGEHVTYVVPFSTLVDNKHDIWIAD